MISVFELMKPYRYVKGQIVSTDMVPFASSFIVEEGVWSPDLADK